MKIGIETECLHRNTIGIEYAILALIEGIKQQNHQAVCFHTKTDIEHYPPDVEHYCFKKALRIPFYRSIASLFRHRCFDQVGIMHFPVPKILYFKKPNVPFVLTIHDLIPLRFPHLASKRSVLLTKHFLSKYLKEASAIIAISHHTKQELLRLFPISEEKVHVIYNSLIPKNRQVSWEKNPYLLYIGSFEPRKNLKGLIEAFTLLRAWGYDYKLILAGREDKRNKPPWELIRKYGLENQVIYKGYISEEEKEALFQKAAALVWPSFYEGFGFPLLEAMHYGTPIVTSKGSSIEEVVEDAGICVDPSNSLEIAQATAKIISSQDATYDLMRKGLRRAKDFSFDTMVKSLKELYESISR